MEDLDNRLEDIFWRLSIITPKPNKPDYEYAIDQVKQLIDEARISELEHVDDRSNVYVYCEGLQPVNERIKQLKERKKS